MKARMDLATRIWLTILLKFLKKNNFELILTPIIMRPYLNKLFMKSNMTYLYKAKCKPEFTETLKGKNVVVYFEYNLTP